MLTKQLEGALATRQMGEYLVRSLPSNEERARSDYEEWLFKLCGDNRLRGQSVDPTSPMSVANLYQKHNFRVKGSADLQDIVSLLHDFYAKDYLHRIKSFGIKPTRDGRYELEMSVDAVALNAATDEANDPGDQSWRVDRDPVAYVDPIMNRNMFNPPNQPPRFTGNRTVKAIIGRSTPVPLTFEDPEKSRVLYELLTAPEELVQLDSRSGTLRILSEEKQEFEVQVRATDQGFPRKSVDQTLLVQIVDPPPPPAEKEPPPPPPKFDDASQTVLTGLVQGRNDWTAWMDVRTRGKTLKLQKGDTFEIGTVKGTITDITAKFAEIEVEGRRFTLSPNGILGKAAAQAKED